MISDNNKLRKLAGLPLNQPELLQENTNTDNKRKLLSVIKKFNEAAPNQSVLFKSYGSTGRKLPISVERLSDSVKSDLITATDKANKANNKQTWNDAYHSFKSVVKDLTTLVQALKEIEQQRK